MQRKGITSVSLAGLLLWALMAVGLYGQESKSLAMSATTSGVVLATDGPYTGAYDYRYTAGDRVCRVESVSSPSVPEPGTEIQVHYNPNNICDSVTYDPVVNFIGVLVLLAGLSAAFAFIGWLCWLSGDPQEFGSWQQS